MMRVASVGRFGWQIMALSLVASLALGAMAGLSPQQAVAQGASLSAGDLVKKGKALMAKKSYEPAEAIFREALAKDPKHVAAYEGLGQSLIKRRQWNAAIKVYEKALVAVPDWSRAEYQLGYTYRKMGEYEKAVEHYQKYIISNSDDPDAYYGLGQAHYKGGENAKALAAFKIYVKKEKRPSEQKWVSRTKEIIATLEEGADTVEQPKATKDPTEQEGPAPEGDLDELVQRGDLAFQEKNYSEALSNYRGAAQKDEGVEAFYKLGVTLAITGDLVGAISAWEKVLEREPSMKAASEHIAKARKKLQSQADKGIDDPRLGQGLDEQLELASVYAKGGRHAMAMRVLDPLADKHPEDHRVRSARARSLMSLSRYQEAAFDLELALSKQPGDIKVLGALGEVYIHLADHKRALYFLKRYLERVDPAGRDNSHANTRATVKRLEAAISK